MAYSNGLPGLVAKSTFSFITDTVEEYDSTGTRPGVNTVENSKPPIIAIAIGSRNPPPLISSGIKPGTVVAVVSSMGRSRLTAASMMAV
jgi:hypothetical protein